MNILFCPDVSWNALFRASLVFGTALIGFVVYSVVLSTVLKEKAFYTKSYYRLLVSLGFADCLGLLVFIIYSSTAILCGPHDIWGGRTANGSWGAVLNIGWFSAIPSMVVLSINRYMQLNRSDEYNTVFSSKNTRIWIAGCWIIGTVISIPTFLSDCYILYDHEFSGWVWDTDKECADRYAQFELIFALSAATVSFFLFGLIYRHMRKQHSEIQDSSTQRDMWVKRHRPREVRLTIQCFLVTLYFICYDIALVICSYVPINETQALMLTMGYILNNCINVIVYLALNK